jgi:5-(carboxyamino)imidazole ribonucleotide mutase
MSETPPVPAIVGIIMGSQSDWPTMKHAADTLEDLGVPFEARIVSAHRTPKRMVAYAETARDRGLKCIIAGAGGAAHLPGMTASMTPLPVFGVPVDALLPAASLSIEARWGACYVRLRVLDRPGVIADVTAALRDQSVSVESILQRGRDPEEAVDVVLTLHETSEAAVTRALSRISALEAVLEPPRLIRIER